MNIPRIYNPETDKLVSYGNGTKLVSRTNDKLFVCTHFDSKDTILENVETKETKILNSMSLKRYYVLAIEGYNYEA